MKRILSYWWITLILGVVVVVAIPSLGEISDLQITKAFYDLNALNEAVERYRTQNGVYPSELALASPIGNDLWGRRYRCRPSDDRASYALYSGGLDGEDDGGAGDDITNPSKQYGCALYGVNCPPRRDELIAYAAACLIVLSLVVGAACGAA